MNNRKWISLLLVFTGLGFALQGGPTQPDYMQFEPADMPDLVNMYTGDFAYSVPLGEVPGPYGGFPISMSYHGGVSPQQEASWVGLGWTLNPGAINRNMRGVPDDQFHGGTLGFIYQYSAMSTWGVSMGYSNGAVSVGMTVSSHGGVGFNATVGPKLEGIGGLGLSAGTDGVGVTASVGIGGTPLSVNGSLMIGPNGKPTVGAGVGIKGAGGAVGASVGASFTPGSGVSKNAGFSVNGPNGASAGLKVSGNGVVPSVSYGMVSVSPGGVSVGVASVGLSVANMNNGNTSSKATSRSVGLIIPTPIGVFSFGYNTTLYESWVRQATSEYTYGYMYQGGPAIVADAAKNDILSTPGTGSGSHKGSGTVPWQWNFKGRSLEYVGTPGENLHPAYDIYSVASPGASGTFRPFAASEHTLYMSLRSETDDGAPSPFSYLLDADPASSGVRNAQYSDEYEYTAATATAAAVYASVLYAYHYKLQGTEKTVYAASASYASPENALANGVSPYAYFKTRYVNESNRMVYLATPGDGDRVRSRMEFRFIGHGAGYYESESIAGAQGKGEDYIQGDNFQRKVNGWNYGLIGSQRIEPILEDDSPVGGLQGFRIIAADGSKYIFKQPVRSYLKVDYSINRERGFPVFVDKKSSADKAFIDNLKDAFVAFVKVAAFPSKAIYDAITAAGHLTEKCKSGTDGQIEDYLYSYQVNMNPYATQWLLTEVQGSDFVDLANGDETKMSQNLGNHVLLHYSTPSIYRWRFPFARPYGDPMQAQNYRQPRQGETPAGCGADMYTASFGYKESVYLESIETATHKAVFHLNEKERVDGKGWELAENTEASAQNQIPIFTAATLKMTSSISMPDGVIFTGYSQNTVPHHYFSVTYNVKEVYFNNKITDELANNLIGKTIPIAGVGSPEEEKGFSGYKVTQPSSGGVKGVVNVKVTGFAKVTGKETRWGLYKFVVDAALAGQYFTSSNLSDASSHNKNGTSELDYIWLGENANENLNGLGVQFSTAVVPFIDWASVYRLGANDNQMRSLDSITYCRKNADGSCNASYRTFAFGYDYSLQPGTLNSYCSGKYPANVDEMRSTPASTAYDVCASAPASKSLYGKLTLQSITESACRDGSCAALPPFRFGYNSPAASSLRLGSLEAYKARNAQALAWYNEDETNTTDNAVGLSGMDDMDVTIMNTNDQTDEWGFWNWSAHAENHKVTQENADYAASAWSLQKIVDPAGGVMEVEYERDTYSGTSFEAEKKYANIYDYGICSSFGISGTNAAKTCVVFGPMYWKKDCLAGKPAYWEAGAKDGQSYEYLDSLGISKGGTAYFNVASIMKTKVKCGLWGLGRCTRRRSVALYGSGDLAFAGTLSRTQIKGMLGDDWEEKYQSADYSGLDAGEAARVYALTDREWTEIENGLVRSAKKINSGGWTIRESGRYGSLFVGQPSDTLKGGDIRVKRLTRHDMGVNQSTEYQYEFARDGGGVQAGELPQLPDSALNAVLATRTMATKLNVGMPDMNMAPKSRIVGIGDEELYYLPESKVVYPRVQVRNGRDGAALNGYTEFRYVTPETGVPEAYVASIADVLKPFLRLNVGLWIVNNTAQTNMGGRVFSFTATDSAGNTQTRDAYLFEERGTSLYFYKENGGFDPARLLKIEVSNAATKDNAKNIVKTIALPGGALGNYGEAWLSVQMISYTDNLTCKYIDDYDGFESLRGVELVQTRRQGKGFVPILYKEVAYAKETVNYKLCDKQSIVADVESRVVYHDLSAFIGKNVSTTFYRGSGSGAIPVRSDSMVYAAQVPSVRTEAFGTVPGNWGKLGQQKESWKFTGSLDCKNFGKDACKNAYPEVYGRASYKYSKSAALVRYPVFVVEAVNRTGFENQGVQANGAKMMVQRTTNHAFDPQTGAPTLTVAHSALGDGKEIRKATRVTPHWYLSTASGSSVANEMFERNMLAQNFLEEVYSWDAADESLDNGALPKANLRSVKISPYNYATPLLPGGLQSELTGKRQPIVALGSFTSKVDPAKLTDDLKLFQSAVPGLDKYNGTRILAVDRFYKVNESVDGLGRKLSAYYSADGLYQTGLFYPAARVATAQWVSSNPYGDDQNGKAAQSFALSAVADSLVVEFQAQAGLSSSVTLSYGGVTKTLTLAAGVKSYRVVLDKAASGTVSAQFSGAAYLRYFRAYPQGCQAKSYRYDAYGSMVQAVDERNVSAYYEYDVFGNLQQIRNDDGVVFKSHSREMVNGGM